MMRRPGRGLVGAMATTAVVAGTAGAVHHRQEQKWASKEAEQQAAATQQTQAATQQAQMDQMQAQMQQLQAQEAAAATAAPAASAAAPAGASADVVAQLNQLVQLHTAGVLSDEEFAAAKAKLLG